MDLSYAIATTRRKVNELFMTHVHDFGYSHYIYSRMGNIFGAIDASVILFSMENAVASLVLFTLFFFKRIFLIEIIVRDLYKPKALALTLLLLRHFCVVW